MRYFYKPHFERNLRFNLFMRLFYRTVPLYLFAPMDEQPVVHLTDFGDSGVVSSTQSTIDPCSASTFSR